jgi:hypothetical protein
MKRTKWSTCKSTGKRRFRTEHDAKVALKVARDSSRDHRKECRYYECDDCGGWHLTSQRSWTDGLEESTVDHDAVAVPSGTAEDHSP